MCSRTVDEKHARHICTKLRKSADIVSVFMMTSFLRFWTFFSKSILINLNCNQEEDNLFTERAR